MSNSLAGKHFVVPMFSGVMLNYIGDVCGGIVTLKFNRDKTVTGISSSGTIWQTSLAGYWYDDERTSTMTFYPEENSASWEIDAPSGSYFGWIPGTFKNKATFNSTYTEIVKFEQENEELDKKRKMANDIMSFVTVETRESLETSIREGISKVSGASDEYAVDDIDYDVLFEEAKEEKENVAIALIASTSWISFTAGYFDVISNKVLAKLVYKNRFMESYTPPGASYCGKEITFNNEKASEIFQNSTDVYDIPLTLENRHKRLNGVSDGTIFTPDFTIFKDQLCDEAEIVKDVVDDDGNVTTPGYVKHFYPRGIDLIAGVFRLETALSEKRRFHGRTLLYCRLNEELLDNQYFFPDGREFRINMHPQLIVKAIVFNGKAVPKHLIKRKNWDKNEKDGSAVTFNLVSAGVDVKYSTGKDYVENHLNEVEIHYYGQVVDTSEYLWSDFQQVPSDNGTDIADYFPGFLDRKAELEAELGVEPSKPVNGDYIMSDLTGFTQPEGYTNPKYGLTTHFARSNMHFNCSDGRHPVVYYLFPTTSGPYDRFYGQFEFLAPKQFHAHMGGTKMDEVVYGNKKLTRILQGKKAVGNDMRTSNSTGFAFRINLEPDMQETVQLTNKSIQIINELPESLYDWYNDPKSMITVYWQRALIKEMEYLTGIDFPYDTFGYNLGNFSYGGMENIERAVHTLTRENHRGWTVYKHELAHMWFQNSMGFKSMKDYWIDEGLATLMTFGVEDVIGTDKRTEYNVDNVNPEMQKHSTYLWMLWMMNNLDEHPTFYGDVPIAESYGQYNVFISFTIWYSLAINMGAEFKTGTELPNEPVKSSMSSISNATAYWGCMTALLTEYKDKTYTYSDIKGFIGDYVANNAATSWQGKWPQTKSQVNVFFEAFVENGTSFPIEYRPKYHADLLPEEWVTRNEANEIISSTVSQDLQNWLNTGEYPPPEESTASRTLAKLSRAETKAKNVSFCSRCEHHKKFK